MEAELINRLRTSVAAGRHNGRAAIDLVERASNDAESFPSVAVTVISNIGDYTHEGPTNYNRPRVRFEVFGKTYSETKLLARAIRSEIEIPIRVGDVRFHHGKLQAERDFPPEKIGGDLSVFRIVLDFFLPYTTENN